ncbi:ATP-dependent RNA helicase DHX36 [Trichogramma pretiosum]|uniref:ATP-dependent RNA helicase DHX36 n=1 Tax=Trichogramma pretiosum TaxID=7493 RepID=UPI0006C9DB6C|nr:ATP-dependent RNA helicase DHX36 [Trichogramma pretiosum]
MSHKHRGKGAYSKHGRRETDDFHLYEGSTSDKSRGRKDKSAKDRSPHRKDKQSHSGPSHPPGLKGKEIGLYYRDKQKAKNARKDDTVTLKLHPSTERQIKDLIDVPKSSYDKHFNLKDVGDDTSFESRYNHINESQFKKKFLSIITGTLNENLEKALAEKSKLVRNERLDIQLLDELAEQQAQPRYKKMMEFRMKLPAYEKKQDIINLLSSNQVILISGETGCGKTTQVAQFLLDYELECGRGSTTNIICTQPRRISAVSVAERVAAERADRLGNSVGYHIRLERKLARPYGSVTFCTTAMLLQFLQMDPALKNYSHIILDEIHERSTQSDFIITLLKQILPRRPTLKLILMSATLNSEQFSKYYDKCPTLHIPGFTYPVEEYYLEDVLHLTNFKFEENIVYTNGKKRMKKQEAANDTFEKFIGPYIRQLQHTKKYPQRVLDQLKNPKSEELSIDLVFELVRHICSQRNNPGAILIFLPGVMDITKLHRQMQDSHFFPSSRYDIYPLHSRMPTIDQKRVFQVPRNEVRKIIIATSIAETSITIEDVVYVIDCGRTKLTNFQVKNNLDTLDSEWISEANALQRKGRAGRVKAGICYHLYTKCRAAAFDKYPLPEMLRTRLDEVILQVKILQIGKADRFLASMMDPPEAKAIDLSLKLLRELNALDEKENLTPLGYHLARLPLDPRTGKMIIWAAMFSCIDPVFSIAASLSFKDAFYCPMNKEEEARKKKLELGQNQYSDHIALAEALSTYEELSSQPGNAAYSFCRRYFLSWNTLKLLSDMKQQFARYLCEMKFLANSNPKDGSANTNSLNKSLVKAIVCAGLYPNVAIVKGVTKGGVRCVTTEEEKVKLHISSINDKARSFPSPYLTYYLKRKSTGIFLFDTTCVSPWALLFASPNANGAISSKSNKSIIKLGPMLQFNCESGTAHIFQKLHKKLDALLENKINHPGTIDWNSNEGNILRAIILLLSVGDENMGVDSGRYDYSVTYDENSASDLDD